MDIKLPSLENGFSIIFWIKIDNDLLKNYNKCYPNVEINLININVFKNRIKFQLDKEKNNFKIQFISSETNEFETPPFLLDNKWNYVCFVFNPKIKEVFTVQANNNCASFKIPIPKNFPLNQKIDNIKLFENFWGKITLGKQYSGLRYMNNYLLYF